MRDIQFTFNFKCRVEIACHGTGLYIPSSLLC